MEEKATGSSLIPDLNRVGMPIIPITPTKDKLTRVEEVLEYIASGQVLLPVNKTYGNNADLLNQCQAFTRDNSHLHDDMVDTLCYLINNTIQNRQISILDVL
jgi:predicted phage terminase large subunit-like protein